MVAYRKIRIKVCTPSMILTVGCFYSHSQTRKACMSAGPFSNAAEAVATFNAIRAVQYA